MIVATRQRRTVKGRLLIAFITEPPFDNVFTCSSLSQFWEVSKTANLLPNFRFILDGKCSSFKAQAVQLDPIKKASNCKRKEAFLSFFFIDDQWRNERVKRLCFVKESEH
jgi:hypothetical protein